jgi:hypothetical protein
MCLCDTHTQTHTTTHIQLVDGLNDPMSDENLLELMEDRR